MPRGMGRGLAAILPAPDAVDEPDLRRVPVALIRPNPDQPRRRLDPESIAALSESIAAAGVIQPLIVRSLRDGRYELIAGERRWRAAQRAGLEAVPALVREEDEAGRLETALIENVAREDLNPVDQARAYAVLADELDLTQTEIARRVGKSRPAVANTMRLLELPDDVLGLVAGGDLSEGHGRALLLASGQDERSSLARTAVSRGWSVRECEAAAKRTAKSAKREPKRAAGVMDDELAHLAVDAAWQSLGLRASVRKGPRGGRVELHFSTAAELGRIVDQLRADRVSWAD
jgi:ParB family transcriptional regulator, chromosome partitioning protein